MKDYMATLNQPPVPTPAPPADPNFELAQRFTIAQEKIAAPVADNALRFERQVSAVEKTASVLEKQTAFYSAPLPDDEVWLRIYNALCSGGRPDIAEAEADKGVQRYKARFPRSAQ